MKKFLIPSFLLLSALSAAESYTAYKIPVNSESIEHFMNLFRRDMVMIDVGRRFDSTEGSRRWAQAEDIPHGGTFRYLRTLASVHFDGIRSGMDGMLEEAFTGSSHSEDGQPEFRRKGGDTPICKRRSVRRRV